MRKIRRLFPHANLIAATPFTSPLSRWHRRTYLKHVNFYILRIDRILTPNSLGKLRIVPAGKRYLLGFFNIKQKEILLNIPEECRKNVVIDHLLITEISKVFEDGDDHHILDVNKTSALSKKLKRNSEVKSLFTLDFRSNP